MKIVLLIILVNVLLVCNEIRETRRIPHFKATPAPTCCCPGANAGSKG